MPPKKRVHVGCEVATNVWRFVTDGEDDWVRKEYDASWRRAMVNGIVTEANGHSKWNVRWEWENPDAGKREGESPSTHLTIVRTEIEIRRAAVRAGLGAGHDDDDDDEEEEDDDGDDGGGSGGSGSGDDDGGANEQEEEEEEEEEEGADPETLLSPNDLPWTNAPVGMDMGVPERNVPTSFRGIENPESRELIDWFLLLFPALLPSIITWTNKLGKSKYNRWRDTTKGELLRYFGLWLTIATIPAADSRRDYFEKEWIGILPGPRLNRFMWYTRFVQLTTAISFADMTVSTSPSAMVR